MKILALAASPHEEGHGAKALRRLEELAAHRATFVARHLRDYRIEPLGETPLLEGEDDYDRLMDEIDACDVLLCTMPLHTWGPPGPLKMLMDRQVDEILRNASRPSLRGKKVAWIVTAEGPIEGNADLIAPLLRRFAGTMSWHQLACCILPHCRDGDLPPESDEGLEDLLQAILPR